MATLEAELLCCCLGVEGHPWGQSGCWVLVLFPLELEPAGEIAHYSEYWSTSGNIYAIVQSNSSVTISPFLKKEKDLRGGKESQLILAVSY